MANIATIGKAALNAAKNSLLAFGIPLAAGAALVTAGKALLKK